MADNYDDILDRAWDDLPEPVHLFGDWVLVGKNAAFMKGENGKKSRQLFFFGVAEPLDVDPEFLAELGDEYDLGMNQIVHTIYIDNDRDWNDVRRFLRNVGVDTEGLSVKESLKAFTGTRVAASLGVRTYVVNGEARTDNVASRFTAVE
jgi:hypothetical protein